MDHTTKDGTPNDIAEKIANLKWDYAGYVARYEELWWNKTWSLMARVELFGL